MARNFAPGDFSRGVAVTPSDSTDLTGTTGLYIGGAGDVTVTMVGGGVVTFKAPPVGTVLRGFRISRVMAATTATLIIALS